ncbi:MAG: phytanoyl-CoA dioxygenase family protein [Flavobacteriales bacterium]|jgi:ectoine hydroxylase-related dioxygenase (phytanoyl-CoA dioxygenase family)|nr:phytanoyl-CoA dioxygenase family protein [Flavobacteriales bacterium]
MNDQLAHKGYYILDNIYTVNEINTIIQLIDRSSLGSNFGEREFLIKYPEITKKVFNSNLIQLIKKIAPKCNSVIKSIYFDKPPNANWVVNWHQDLTINLMNKANIAGYKNWRENKERVIVQPDQEFLESIFTIRIHLDNCTHENGALSVIDGSHKKGIININNWLQDKKGPKVICEVPQGGILIMKPLLLHASKRTKNLENRRVIHLEFTDKMLPAPLEWKEAININTFNS